MRYLTYKRYSSHCEGCTCKFCAKMEKCMFSCNSCRYIRGEMSNKRVTCLLKTSNKWNPLRERELAILSVEIDTLRKAQVSEEEILLYMQDFFDKLKGAQYDE